MHPWTLYALEIWRDRERELRDQRLLDESSVDRSDRRSRLRRPVALILAALTRGSVAAVRRLDDCVADDLGQSLALSRE